MGCRSFGLVQRNNVYVHIYCAGWCDKQSDQNRNLSRLLGLTQADLEGDGEFDHSYISRLERGKRQVCLRGILHLSAKLQMELNDLVLEVVKRLQQ